MTILQKTVDRFSATPIILPKAFFTELEQKVSNFVWRLNRPQIATSILKKKNGTAGVRFPDFRL